MKKIIYKYGPLTGLNKIKVRGRIVHAEFRDEGIFTTEQGIYVWSELNNFEEDEYPEYEVALVATGENYNGFHCKTVVMPSGLVWHVVEVL